MEHAADEAAPAAQVPVTALRGAGEVHRGVTAITELDRRTGIGAVPEAALFLSGSERTIPGHSIVNHHYR